MASVKFYKNDIAYPKVLADKLNKLADMPDAMEFKGSLGVGGTITALPVDGSAKKGDTYKVITDGTYAGQTAKIGDLFICNEKTSSSNTWVLIPSGDEPSGTVTSVKIEANAPISVNDSTPITSSGTRTISHNTSGVGAGSYGPTADVVGTDNATIKVPQITVDSYGHITGVAERTYTSKDTDTKVTSADNHYGYASGSGKASGLYKVATDDAGHVTETTAVAKADITALGIPDSDTNTHRPIQVDGTEVLGDNVTPLNLSGGTNISLSDDGSGKVTIDANIPKTEHELIYFSEDKVGENEYDGLFTQQLMYDGGIVVDNETDFNYCKEHYEYSDNKVGMQAIIGGWTRGYVDNMTPIKEKDWAYNKDTDSIDATNNDNDSNYWADMKNSYYYLKNIADIGFYKDANMNDGIGIIFQRQFKDENDNYYVDKIYLDCGNRYKNGAHYTMILNISRVKRSKSSGNGTIVKSLSISTAPENMTSATTADGYVSIISGTDIVPIAATASNQTYLTRVETTKNNKVITFHFSNAFDISTRNTEEHPINYDRYIKIDLQNHKLTIKKQGENAKTYDIGTTPRVYDSGGTLINNYLTAPNTQWVSGDTFTDVLDSLAEEAHFGYWQYSTPNGRVYNNYYVTGQKVTFSNIILRTDNKTVWEKNDDGVWVQIPNIEPIDVFTGSRLNYNHITNKLFYSNGGKIYELKTDSGGGGTGGTSGINITTSSEDETYPILLGNTNDAESNVTNIQKSIGLVVNPKKKSVAEGEGTTATGNYSHAEGSGTTASGNFSHAEGHGLDSNEIVTFVCSKIGAEEQKAIYAKTGINFTYCVENNTINDAYGSQGYIYNDEACTQFISKIDVYRFYSVDNYHGDYFNIKNGSLTNGNTYYWKRVCLANGGFSHVEGNSTTASGESAHAEGSGTTASGNYSHAEGSGTTASGIHSHAEGSDTIAYSSFSHAEGGGTIASGVYAHAEGGGTIASGVYAHAEGGGTIASGVYAHAEGSGTTASGNYSHASGQYTIANRKSQTVVGEYNDESLTDALFVVGNGTGKESKSNAFYVKNDGSVYASGAYYSASDKRKKDIIGNIDLEKAYSLLETCQTVTYTWKDDESKKQQVGVIAQEIEQFFPEIVNEDEHGMLSVDYSRLTVILLAVIRDLTQKVSKIDTLEEKIKQLENKIQ